MISVFAGRTRCVALLCCALGTTLTARPGAGQEPIELTPAARFDGAGFSRIRELVDLGPRGVVLVDQIEDAVYHVDVARGTRRRIGRSGPGPGEYDTPTGIGPWAGDSLVITDAGNGRLVVLSADLEAARTMPFAGEHYSIPRATDGAGRLYFDQSTRVRLAQSRGGSTAELAPIIRWDPFGARSDTIGRVRVPVGSGVSFPPYDLWAVGRDGRVAIVRNQDEYRVDWVLADGRVVRGPRVDDSRVRVTDRDREVWRERAAGGVNGLRRAGEPPPRPPELPSRLPYADYGGVFVDPAGRAWVTRQQSLTETRPLLDVFDANGRRIAQVRLPANREVITVARDRLWAVRVDDVGLQWLERYDVPNLSGGG